MRLYQIGSFISAIKRNWLKDLKCEYSCETDHELLQVKEKPTCDRKKSIWGIEDS